MFSNNPYGFNNSYMYGNQTSMYSQPSVQAVQSSQNMGYGLTWVQGEVGAKGYQLPPNSTVILMDSENPYFFIKTTDNVGMAQLRKFAFEEVTNESKAPKTETGVNADTYVTRSEFDKLREQLDGLVSTLITDDNNKEREFSHEPIKKSSSR